MVSKKMIRIGNASGYWGDDPKALKRQVEKGPLDYITMDFLAEITMSILQKQYQKDSSLGYAKDFIPMLKEVLPQLLENKTKLITNAGGINPEACCKSILEFAHKMGLKPKIALVSGDNIFSDIKDLYPKHCSFENMETGEKFSQVSDRLACANVYYGASPVVAALRKWDPDIIITGRVTDTGITLAPMIYEFNWSFSDWDKLASGIVAGHILECGSQSTGGNFSDWQKVKNFDEIGYPIAEVSEDGTFVLTKHENTGGFVSVDTVREQIFYEMGNPKAYITPDVVADFSTINLTSKGDNRVEISGVKGYFPTQQYKVSMAYLDGYKAVGSIVISGPQARSKAEKFAEIFWKRCVDTYRETITEYFGWNACHRSLGQSDEACEILLRLGVRDRDPEKVRRFGKGIPALILSGPPGVTVVGGVPRAQSIVNYWPALLDKDLVSPEIKCLGEGEDQSTKVKEVAKGDFDLTEKDPKVQSVEQLDDTIENTLTSFGKGERYSLSKICLGRSGDKGDSTNIGIMARSPSSYKFLKEKLTAQVVKNLFHELCLGRVSRYCLDNLLGLNFILEKSLGGGGSATLRADAQGKTFAQAILRQEVFIPKEILEELM